MKLSRKWLALALGVLVLAGGIGRAIHARKAQQAELAQSTASAQSLGVQLTERDLYTVASQPLTVVLPVSGNVVAQRTAMVKAKVAAELLSLSVREGDTVAPGQVLGQLDPQEFTLRQQQARQQAASARAIWQNAEQTLRNNQALVQQGFISKQALDGSQANASSSLANLEAAQAAADLADKSLRDTRIVAPIGGQIAQRLAQAGERVPVEGRIVEIVDLNTLEWQVAVNPQDLTQVQVGSQGALRIDGVNEAIPAKVVRINPSAAADTRAVMVYLSLPKHPALRHGLFAQGQITLAQRQALAIPPSAITREGGHDQVLQLRGQQVTRVNVRLGARAQATAAPSQMWVEVLDGIQPGDRILVNAAGTVREGASVQVSAASAAASR